MNELVRKARKFCFCKNSKVIGTKPGKGPRFCRHSIPRSLNYRPKQISLNASSMNMADTGTKDHWGSKSGCHRTRRVEKSSSKSKRSIKKSHG